MRVRPVDRERHLASREWREHERRVVWRGLMGRFAIAVEPLLGTIFFGLLAWGIIVRARTAGPPDLWILAPVFGVMAVGFSIYMIALLIAPLIAYAQTFKPIYIVDGYVRYRGPDDLSEIDSTGYAAVLFEDSSLCCEWECFGTKRLPLATIPAMVEFSEYGGIHAIDGTPTGVIPEDLPSLGIGISQRLRK